MRQFQHQHDDDDDDDDDGDYDDAGTNSKVEGNKLVDYPLTPYIEGQDSWTAHNWEILSVFFSRHNIQPNWLNCNFVGGYYDEDLKAWTGCMGKV